VLQELAFVENYDQVIQRRTPRRLKHFPVPTKTVLTQLGNATQLEVITADRPGLLASIGRIFVQYNIRLHSAKISTLGERVEDLFISTDRIGQPITDPEFAERMQRSICETIDQQVVELQK
jgi:[protein-PII] uridylyltransferase